MSKLKIWIEAPDMSVRNTEDNYIREAVKYRKTASRLRHLCSTTSNANPVMNHGKFEFLPADWFCLSIRRVAGFDSRPRRFFETRYGFGNHLGGFFNRPLCAARSLAFMKFGKEAGTVCEEAPAPTMTKLSLTIQKQSA